jgi:HAD superfamily hydrolase (TIGR01509 family)
MNKPTVALFDLGNVLVRYTPETFWDVLRIREKQEQEKYKKGILETAIRFETGRTRTREFFEELRVLFNGQFSHEQLHQATASVLTNPIEGMEDIVRQVSGHAKTALVSNTNEFHYAYCLQAIPVLQLLPKHFLSFEMGVMKPHREFYERVVSDIQVHPSEAVFIDDVHENVEGAEMCGMKGIVFQEPETLILQLKELDLL